MQVTPKNLICQAIKYTGDNYCEVGSMVDYMFKGNSTRTQTSTVVDGEVKVTHDLVTIQLWGKPYRADVGEWIVIDEVNKVVRILSDDWFNRYYEEGE